jgi:hypothetical protein
MGELIPQQYDYFPLLRVAVEANPTEGVLS